MKVPVRHISSAVTQTSPSPCTPWPSPTEKFAPGTHTGRYSVLPAVISLLSRLPPWMRGSFDAMVPNSGGGATPITPKNGASVSSVPQGSEQTPRARVHRDVAEHGLVEILRQRAGERADHVVAPVGTRHDLLDADLQHVARHRAGDGDRAGHDMAGLHAGIGGDDGRQFRRDGETGASAGGITSWRPETHCTRRVSPDSMVITGGNFALNTPIRTVCGDGAQADAGPCVLSCSGGDQRRSIAGGDRGTAWPFRMRRRRAAPWRPGTACRRSASLTGRPPGTEARADRTSPDSRRH